MAKVTTNLCSENDDEQRKPNDQETNQNGSTVGDDRGRRSLHHTNLMAGRILFDSDNDDDNDDDVDHNGRRRCAIDSYSEARTVLKIKIDSVVLMKVGL
jgi:adenine-specific DNA methylase